MALAALFLHPLTSIWWQLGLSSACGLLLLLILAAWLRPWRQNLT